jgi:hypothetical protein
MMDYWLNDFQYFTFLKLRAQLKFIDFLLLIINLCVLSSSEQDIQALIHKINKSIVAPLPTMYSSALWVFCSIIILSYYPIIFLFPAFIQLIYLCPYLSMVGWCKHAYKQILTKLVMCNDHPIHSFVHCIKPTSHLTYSLICY